MTSDLHMPIESGHELLQTFHRGQALGQEVLAAQATEARLIREASQLRLGMCTPEEVLQDPEAALTTIGAAMVKEECEAAETRLAALQAHAGREVIGRRIVVENISGQGKRQAPITIHPKGAEQPLRCFGRPVRRHRAAGRIMDLDLAANELIVRPHGLTFRRACKDSFRVSMLDAAGQPLVQVALAPGRKDASRRSLPLRLLKLAQVHS